MSFKDKLVKDLRWFQTDNLIKRIIISIILSVCNMMIFSGFKFSDKELTSIGFLSFILIYLILYFFLAWVFSDIENLHKDLKSQSLNPNNRNKGNSVVRIVKPIDREFKEISEKR